MLQSPTQFMHKLNKYMCNKNGRELRDETKSPQRNYSPFLIMFGKYLPFMSFISFPTKLTLNDLGFYSFFLFYHLFTRISKRTTVKTQIDVSAYK